MNGVKPPEVRDETRRFIEQYMSNGTNAIAAYRATHSDSTLLSDEDVSVRASNLLAQGNVRRYMQQVRERILFVERAGDPLAVDKEVTAADARDTVADMLARSKVADDSVNSKAARSTSVEIQDGQGDWSDVDRDKQPAPVLHVTVTPVDLIGQSAEIVKYSKDWVLQMLETNLARALQLAPVLDKKGRFTGHFIYNGMVANRALELIARLEGHLVDRKQIDVRQLGDLTDDEITRRKEQVKRQLLELRRESQDIEDAPFTETKHA